jgi:hypothetical protein
MTDTLTINDLESIKNIIDLACRRGAFAGEEARQIGTYYEKLDGFIKAAAQAAAASDSPESDTNNPQGE